MLFTPEEKEFLLTLITIEQSKLASKEPEEHLKKIEMCSLKVLKARCVRSQCQQGPAPS